MHDFAATSAESSAMSGQPHVILPSDTKSWLVCGSSHYEVSNYDEQEWRQDASLFTPETVSENFVYPVIVLAQHLKLFFSSLKVNVLSCSCVCLVSFVFASFLLSKVPRSVGYCWYCMFVSCLFPCTVLPVFLRVIVDTEACVIAHSHY